MVKKWVIKRTENENYSEINKEEQKWKLEIKIFQAQVSSNKHPARFV